MCTNIATRTRLVGTAKAAGHWAAVDEAIIGYDHAEKLWTEHALRLDFVGANDRVAIEVDLASAKALLASLSAAVAAAEASGV